MLSDAKHHGHSPFAPKLEGQAKREQETLPFYKEAGGAAEAAASSGTAAAPAKPLTARKEHDAAATPVGKKLEPAELEGEITRLTLENKRLTDENKRLTAENALLKQKQ